MGEKQSQETNQYSQKDVERMLGTVAASFEEALKSLQQTQIQISKVVQQNQSRITAMVRREKENPPSLIPKEIAQLIPAVIEGIFNLFKEPPVDQAAARQGIFGDTMQKAFETETIAQWKTNTKILEARFTEIDLENQLRRKALADEFV